MQTPNDDRYVLPSFNSKGNYFDSKLHNYEDKLEGWCSLDCGENGIYTLRCGCTTTDKRRKLKGTRLDDANEMRELLKRRVITKLQIIGWQEVAILSSLDIGWVPPWFKQPLPSTVMPIEQYRALSLDEQSALGGQL